MCVICCQQQATQEHQPRALVYTSVRDSHQFPSSLLKRSAGGNVLTCQSSCRNSGCPLGSSQQEGDLPDQPRTPARRQRKVTDIATWVQCFATYVGVLAGMSLEAIPELMAYLVHMVRVSQDFGSLAWVNYDSAFHHQAASTRKRQTGEPSLYSICFSGVARTSKRCDLCLSLTHEVKDCALANESDHDVGSHLKAIESTVLALTSATPSTSAGPLNWPSMQRCH